MSAVSGVMLPYGARLICVMLAFGAAAYASAAAVTAAGARLLLRRMHAWQSHAPERAAGMALALRLLPLMSAALASVVLCLPSYLWLEPRRDPRETMGAACLALAAVGAVGLMAIVLRTARTLQASRQFSRRVRHAGRAHQIDGQPVRVLPEPAAAMAIAGVWRPVLLISQAACASLSPEQLALGLGHEQAHGAARDNLKRLLLAATPMAGAAARTLESAWARLAEWAADDRAVRGDAQRSLTLASTLVAVARLRSLQPLPPVSPLTSTLEHGGRHELSERVARLLAFERAPAPPQRQRRWLGFAIAGAVVWATLQPTTLLAAHTVLERLVR